MEVRFIFCIFPCLLVEPPYFFCSEFIKKKKKHLLSIYVYFAVEMFHEFFPHIIREEAYKVFYTSVGQRISVANYWNDPHHQKLFFETDQFLPTINNQISHNLSSQFKGGITRLNRMILIGGPDDGIIEPWQSRYVKFAHFY